MLGIVASLIAGASMSVQGVFNTRLSEPMGLLESSAFVQGTAFLLALAAVALFGNGRVEALFTVNPLYWLGGVLGLAITVTVMLGIGKLGPTVAVSIILVAQLAVAALIDALGLFGQAQVAFGWGRAAGIALMTGGILLLRLA